MLHQSPGLRVVDESTVLEEQLAYYRARAGEYDEWFYREGRYDRGEAHRRQWTNEIRFVRQELTRCEPFGNVLELACGTGLWTERLADGAARLTALDGSPEMLKINQERIGDRGNVSYQRADLFHWQPRERYDFIFFGFWLSHVPQQRFANFWDTVRDALAPGGEVFFVDSRHTIRSTATNHEAPGQAGVVERKLNDGRHYRIVKMYYGAHELEEKLRKQSLYGQVRATEEFFLYGRVASK